MSALASSGSGNIAGTVKASYPTKRRYIYLQEEVNQFFNYAKVGILIILPLCVAYFSVWAAAGIVFVVFLSYMMGRFFQECTYWWNSRIVYEEMDVPLPTPTLTPLEEKIERLRYFESKYFITTGDMLRYLDTGKIPFENNLDWIEIVSLLNWVSLNVGKHFDDDTEKKGKNK
jgi:hypothetical protein